MKIEIKFLNNNSIEFYSEDLLVLKIIRNAKFGIITGEIYNSENDLLLKLKSSFYSSIRITENNLGKNLNYKNLFFYDSFELNSDKIKVKNFTLIYGRIYWNERQIAKIKYTKAFKYNITLNLYFKNASEDEIYFSTVLYCFTLLNVNLY